MSRRVAGAAGTAIALGLLAACGSGEPVHLSATEVTLTTTSASNPTVAIAPRTGTVYVAWVGTTEGESNVHLARVEDGITMEPVRVNDVPGDAAPHPQAPAKVAVGPEGDVYVVWQNNTIVEGRRFPASDLRFARSTDGGRTFEPAIHVNDDAGGPPASHTFHDLAVASDGTVYVSWIDGRRRATSEDDDDGGPDIRLARSTDGGRSFAPSVVVDEDACPCCRTSVAVGPDGVVYVAWRKIFPGNVRDIVVARSDDGGHTFYPPVRVHEDGWVIDGCPHAGPAVTVDGRGRVHVAWYTGAEGRAGIHYAVSTDGGASFGRPVPLTAVNGIATSQVKAAGDDGAAWLAWEDRSAGGRTPRLTRTGRGGLRDVAEPAASGLLPEIAVEGTRIALAWQDGEAVRLAVYEHVLPTRGDDDR